MNGRFFLTSAAVILAATSLAGAATLTVPGQFPTIQSAIQAARPGDTVLVADGVYTGLGNKDLDFSGKAITVMSANGPENCIIDCQATPQNPFRGVQFVSGETAASVLDGFTITNGATLPGAIADVFNGAAILLTGSSPTIRNCIMTDNHAGCWGGAVCCTNSSPTIINCTISDNFSDDDGGGIFIWSNSHPTIVNTVITDNSTTVAGGGVAFFGGTGATLNGCTIAGNDASFAGGIWASGATLTNCIVWGNGPNPMGGSGSIVSYSNIEGGYAGIGNINVDPLFVDAASGDYHLAAGSPCLDAGDPAFFPVLSSFDMDGHHRIMGVDVDMGADEVHSPDVDGSGAVNGIDLGSLLAQWGTAGIADLNADGTINGIDLGILLANWTM